MYAGWPSGDKGRIVADDASAIRARVEPVVNLDGLAACEIVIEAVPERLDLKVELFGRRADICGPRCVLATNTSSLS
jgi:3-hydroxybutyryl-CoA dehydrogenase